MDEVRAPHGRLGRWARELALHAAVAGLWLALWLVARIQEYTPHASLWFPPAGLSMGAFLVLGWRGMPGVLAASIAATLSGLRHDGAQPAATLLGAGVAFGIAHGSSYLLGSRALVRWGAARPTPNTVTGFLIIAPLAALLATLSGLFAMRLFGIVPAAGVAVALLPWWIGDLVGVIALGPCLAALLGALAVGLGFEAPDLFRAQRETPGTAGWRPLWGKLVVVLLPLLGSAALIVAWPAQAHVVSFFVFFGVVPFMWIAHTEGAVRTYVAAGVVSAVVASVGAALGPGPHTVTFQFAAVILAGSAYFGLAVPLLYADNRHLHRLATTDALTGAATRLFFLETAAAEASRARRFGTPLALVAFDLDQLKPLNDRHGHAYGDAVLAAVGARARATLRASDLLGRMGGDEFAVLLPMNDRQAGAEAAERLSSALRAEPVRRGRTSKTIAASFGVVQLDAGTESVEAALERADRALYEAKRAGRGCVRLG